MANYSGELTQHTDKGHLTPSPLAVCATIAVVFVAQRFIAGIIAAGNMKLGLLSGELLGVALPLLVVVRIGKYDGRFLFPWKSPGAKKIFVAAFAALLATFLTDYLVILTDTFFAEPSGYDALLRQLCAFRTSTEAVEKLFLICIIPAVVEEAFFRGFCQTSLICAYGRRAGILLASAIFAAVHSHPRYFPLYFGLGLMLGGLYQWGGTLWLPVIAHMVNNTWTYMTKAAGWQLPGL